MKTAPAQCQHPAASGRSARLPRRHCGVGCVLLAVFFQTCAVLAAPPPNDNLATPRALSPSVQDTINNADATLEGTETIPSGYSESTYQATAWWTFQPAAFDGWYDVETTGSGIDTVLAIWTGPGLAFPLALVHVNKHASAGSGVSRIRFFASASVSYKISVASRGVARGTVKLKASLTAPFADMIPADPFEGPPFDLPAFSPATANVGGAVANVTANVVIDAGAEISSGAFTLFTPNGTEVATWPVSSANRISGPDVSHGMYAIPFTIPANSTPGAYMWRINVHTDESASVPDTSFGWEGLSPIPSGVPSSITVISDSYAAWLTANSMTGGESVRSADYDNDGLKNLTEFASGTDPRVSSQQPLVRSGNTLTSPGLPVITTVGTGDQTHLRVEFVRRLNDPSLTYTVQFSDDLVNWPNATNAPTIEATGSGFEVLAVEDTVITPARTRRSARVRVTQ